MSEIVNKESSRMDVAPEVFSLPGSDFQAAIETVEDTCDIFDTGSRLTTRTVPGHLQYRYVPFGADDQLPYELIRLVGGDEVSAQNKLFNVLCCYGSGLRYLDPETNKPTRDKTIKKWMFRQSLPSFFLEQVTDMKYFYFSVAVIILNREGTMITRIRHKEACHCRLEAADGHGRIKHLFYGDWSNGRSASDPVEVIPLLDLTDPLGDLMVRLGKEPGPDGKLVGRPTKDRKFAVLMRFPTAGCRYYPIPYYTAMFRGGSYDEKRLISAGKRAKLRRHSSIKYQVEVHYDYWDRLIREEKITDPVKQKERIRREKENIRDFVGGIENSGKVWITGYYLDPNGREQRMVRILNIEGAKEGGDWNEDVQAAANTICYSDNVHPNLVGAVPGKSQSNNSGSDKRELFTLKQALEVAFHDVLEMPHKIAIEFNGWDVEPSVPMVLLTTLDQHTDAKEVNPDKTTKDEDI